MTKKGFTLAETLLTLAIMATLIAIGLSTFNSYDKGIKHLYSNTYYVLDRALYNSITSWVPKDTFNREPFEPNLKNASGETVPISDEEGAKRLCRALIEYINPVEDSNRDSNLMCSSSKAVTDSGDSFDRDKVQFTATNGIRFWISKRYPADPNATHYFIIYADLNGTKLPNSMVQIKASKETRWKVRDPDIFAFAALETGRICPIGLPEVDPRYMTARIQYEEESAGGDEVLLKYSEPSKPLVAAKAEAWGYYLSESALPTGQQTVVPDDEIIDGEPLTYTGYLRNNISKSSKIYSFFTNSDETMSSYVQNDPMYKNSNTLKFQSDPPKHENDDINKPNIGGYNCMWLSSPPCTVIVDKYID